MLSHERDREPQFDYQEKLWEYVQPLTSQERKRLVEAIISPEIGGKVTVNYYVPWYDARVGLVLVGMPPLL
jgi:hypothetical protein